jgi:hypothetical protein
MPNSPDPHLGLARLYIYAYRNVQPALHELRRAEALGYHIGPKEAREAADGYLYRAQWEALRARYTVPASSQNQWLALAQADVARARKLRDESQSPAQVEQILLPAQLWP